MPGGLLSIRIIIMKVFAVLPVTQLLIVLSSIIPLANSNYKLQ